MFTLTPLVLLVLALAGGGVATVANTKAEEHNSDQAIEIVEAEVTDPELVVEQPAKLDALITVNGFPVYSFASCARARAKAAELQKQSPDLQIRANCDASNEVTPQAALER